MKIDFSDATLMWLESIARLVSAFNSISHAAFWSFRPAFSDVDGNRASSQCDLRAYDICIQVSYTLLMAKKSRGGRMTAAKNRAAKTPGGRGTIKKRAAGKRIMTS